MRILFWVRTGNKYGSLEKYTAQFAEICKEQGHIFLLINEIENTSSNYRERLSKAGVTQIVIGESARSPIKTLVSLIKYLRSWQPDIVQLHFVNSMVLPILKIFKVPLAYQTYHSGIDHAISIKTRFLRRIDNLFATRVFAISKRVYEDELKAGVNARKLHQIYLGLDPDDFDKKNQTLEGAKPPFFDDNSVIKIITVGRFFPVKGFKYIVEAAVKVLQRRQDVVWWLVGKEGPDSSFCSELIRASGFENRIFILGQRNDVPALLAQSDFQVVGSLSEGLGLMALEAAACGIPTIAPNIPGLDEVILDGETGLLVDSGSSQALADATIWMLDNPQKRLTMGIEAKKFVTEKFDSKKHISSLVSMFELDYANYRQHHINKHRS
jgi:glycosyltransferase involved in cell wall biosynthesis